MAKKDKMRSGLHTAEAEFYKHAIEYNSNNGLRARFARCIPDGVVIKAVCNQHYDEDTLRFPDKHPIEEYCLCYGEDGFVVQEKWNGDFFPHAKYVSLIVSDGKLIFNRTVRDTIPILGLFPGLTAYNLDEKIFASVANAKSELERQMSQLETDIKLKRSRLKSLEAALSEIHYP